MSASRAPHSCAVRQLSASTPCTTGGMGKYGTHWSVQCFLARVGCQVQLVLSAPRSICLYAQHGPQCNLGTSNHPACHCCAAANESLQSAEFWMLDTDAKVSPPLGLCALTCLHHAVSSSPRLCTCLKLHLTLADNTVKISSSCGMPRSTALWFVLL